MSESRAATPAQMAQTGFMVAIGVTKALSKSNATFDQLQNLTQEEADKLGAEVLMNHFKLIEEKWFDQKKHISLFWKKFFNHEVDWSQLTIKVFNSKFKRLELSIAKFSCQQILDAYTKEYGKDKVYKYWDKKLDDYFKNEDQQARPETDYVFAHVGGDEPDKEHLGKSYDDAMQANLTFMILKEGLIAAFRYRFETGKMLDVKGLTRLATLDSDGNAMCMFGDSDGRFYIDWGDRDYRYSGHGPREVSF
jgi:hypothetical protein